MTILRNDIQNSTWPDVFSLKQFPCTFPSILQSSIEDTAGILLSPDFPQDYPNEANCRWNLNVPTGTHLILQFWAFDIEVKIMTILISKYYHALTNADTYLYFK